MAKDQFIGSHGFPGVVDEGPDAFRLCLEVNIKLHQPFRPQKIRKSKRNQQTQAFFPGQRRGALQQNTLPLRLAETQSHMNAHMLVSMAPTLARRTG